MKMKLHWFWFENADGQPDTMLSFAIMAFGLVFVKVLFAGVVFHIGGETYTLAPIDAATIGALLTPTLTAYVVRRYTTAKFTDANNNGVDDNEEKKVV
jgi:hypothetical protein